MDQQSIVPGTVIELGPEARKFLKEAIREVFVEAVKLLDYGDYIVTFEQNGKVQVYSSYQRPRKRIYQRLGSLGPLNLLVVRPAWA